MSHQEDYVKLLAERTTRNNHYWFDFSWEGKQAYETGIFSKHKAEFVSWRMHYWTYYKESVGYCDWGYAKLFNRSHPKGYGHTPEAEPLYLNAITGKNDTFEDGLEMGRRAPPRDHFRNRRSGFKRSRFLASSAREFEPAFP